MKMLQLQKSFILILCISYTVNSAVINVYDEAVVDYRLPQIYNPTSYDISLNVPELTEATTTFSGTTVIKFRVTQETNTVTFHSSHEYLTIKSVNFNNIDIDVSDLQFDNVTDKVLLNFTAGGGLNIRSTYTLKITYEGTVNDKDMYGFYKSNYVDAQNVKHYVGVTQFEPVHARRMFPCFDEPSFKSTFNLSLTTLSEAVIFFNTPVLKTEVSEDKKTTTTLFKVTPKMSTYLLAMAITDFTCSSGANIEGDNIPYKVCSKSTSTDDEREWAVEMGPKLLQALNTFTNYAYSLNMDKMDQLAIPDFAAGAMENWGLVTYRENALLWNPEESSNANKQSIATVIAHEFAHQWFGNLVTCKWWSETFINEGFARYFEYFITHEVLSDWELDKQFVTAQVQTVLAADALENVQALQSNCSTPSEISAKFGTISYSKGGSIVRMVSHIMGKDTFKAGLQTYLTTLKNDNAEPDQLWDNLQKNIVPTYSQLPENTDLKTVMKNWVSLSGFPLLTATVDGSKLKISQERFLQSGEDKTSKWFVPITYSESTGASTFDSTKPQAWLTDSGDAVEITLPDDATWVILNNQQTGYYRVNYEDAMWSNIATALEGKDFSNIHELNRAQIVDDLFNLAKINKVKYSKTFETIEFLTNDTAYYPWVPALSGFDYLLQRVGQNSVLGKNITEHMLKLMKNVYNSVPLTTVDTENQIYTLKQTLVASWACVLEDADCVKQATSMFKDYQTNNTKVNPNLRSIVYCTALRDSTDTKDWDFLWEKHGATDLASEQLTIISALGCSKNAEKLKYYLGLTLDENSGIRSQNAITAFAAVYRGNPENVDIAFDFLVENYEEIMQKYNSMNALVNLITGISAKFTTNAQVTKLKDFLNTATGLSDEVQEAVNLAVKTAEDNVQWIKQYEADLKSYYKINGAGHLQISLLLICVTSLFVKYL